MRILSAEETAALLPYPALAESIARVLADHARGQITAPERLVLPLAGGATLLLMPAADPTVTVTKLVTVHPQQHPSVRAEVWVMHTDSGKRLALLEGSVVTARRTAAVSLLAAQILAPKSSGPLLIIGAGTQGKSHLEAFQEGLGTDKVYVYSRNFAHAEALASYARHRGMLAQAISTLEPALQEASLIVCATTSQRCYSRFLSEPLSLRWALIGPIWPRWPRKWCDRPRFMWIPSRARAQKRVTCYKPKWTGTR